MAKREGDQTAQYGSTPDAVARIDLSRLGAWSGLGLPVMLGAAHTGCQA